MDPLTIGVLVASVIVALGGASFAGLKAWNGWLELKKMELTHAIGERAPPARRAAGSRSPIFASESASLKRSPPGSISNR